MQNAFADMIRNIRDANWKPIFKVGKDDYRDMVDMDGNTTEQILDALNLAMAENKLGIERYFIDNSDNLRHNVGKEVDSMEINTVDGDKIDIDALRVNFKHYQINIMKNADPLMIDNFDNKIQSDDGRVVVIEKLLRREQEQCDELLAYYEVMSALKNPTLAQQKDIDKCTVD